MIKKTILWSALIIVLIAVGGLVFFAKRNKKSEPVAQTTPTDDISSWKTYTNTKYHFSFQYPEQMIVGIPGPSSLKVEESDTVTVFNDSANIFTAEVRTAELAQQFNLPEKSRKVWRLPLTAYAQNIWSGNKNDPNPNVPDKRTSELDTFNLNGMAAYKFFLEGSYYGDDVDGGYTLNEKHTYVISGTDQVKLQMYFKTADATANRILSSVKFAPR